MLKVLSLGAGVQSSTLLLMALKGELERPDCAVFADTGWEPKAVYEHLERLKAECERNGFHLHLVSQGCLPTDLKHHINNWQDESRWAWEGQPPFSVIDRTPKPGMPADDGGGRLWRHCTREYKIKPIHRHIRRMLGFKKGQRMPKEPVVERWYGISIDECQRMRDSREKWAQNRYPLIDAGMDRNNCKKWLERNGWGEVPRSSCVGCPYHSNAYWRRMKKYMPDEWADAVAFDKELRKQQYPGVTGKVYIHRDMVPLDEVDLSTDRDRGQLDLFGEECEGMCGV